MNINAVYHTAPVAKLNNQNGNPAESFTKQLLPGQLLRATVLEVFEDFAFLDIQGHVVRAQNQADKPLTANQELVIRVDAQLDDMLLVKIESDEALAQQNAGDSAMRVQLQRLGFPVKESLLNVLRALHEQQLPPSREAVIALRDAAVSFQHIAKQLAVPNEGASLNWTQSTKQQAIALTAQTAVLAESTVAEAKAAVDSVSNALNSDAALADQLKTNTVSAKLANGATNTQNNLAENAANASVKQASGFEIKQLNNLLTEHLLTIANKGEAHVTNLLAAMEKFDVEQTPLNTVLFNQLLTGKLDAFSELLNALKPARNLLPQQLVQLLDDYSAKIVDYDDFAEKLDGKAIKELTELAKAIERELTDLKLVSQSEQRTEQLAVAQRSMSLIGDQINWQAIHIPMQLKQELRDAEIYIANNHKKGAKFNSDDGLVYIALNTKQLATVRVKLNFKKDLLNIHFVTESDDYSTHIKRFEDTLLAALEPHIDRQLSVTYSIDQADFNLAEMTKVDPVRLTAFDHKV